MNFRFDNDRFLRLTESQSAVERSYGLTVARNLLRRINLIQNVTDSRELFGAAGRFHELAGDRKGVFAFDLSGNQRLTVRFEDQRKMVVIIGVEDYH